MTDQYVLLFFIVVVIYFYHVFIRERHNKTTHDLDSNRYL